MSGSMLDLAAALAGVGAEVEQEVPLATLTTLRVGGPARILVTVEDEPTLVTTAAIVRDTGVPLLVVGRGSNLLVGDHGWPGVVLRLGGGFRGIAVAGSRVEVGAAEPMPSVAVRTAQEGLGGFAWGAAVPGSMGGGVRMNAGAHGADMSDSLVVARVFDTALGAVENWDRERLGFGYRSSALRDTSVVVGVELELVPTDPVVVLDEIDSIRAWRREHQPLNRPSCGSVFTNPPGTSAGALIEKVGLKGTRIGGAEVSATHANFIITSPEARASDVEQLIELVHQRVLDATGITLSAEVVRPSPPSAR